MTKESRIHSEENIVFSINGVGKTGQMQKNETGHFIEPCTKINSKWIKDLKVRLHIIKLLEENIGQILSDITTAISSKATSQRNEN